MDVLALVKQCRAGISETETKLGPILKPASQEKPSEGAKEVASSLTVELEGLRDHISELFDRIDI